MKKLLFAAVAACAVSAQAELPSGWTEGADVTVDTDVTLGESTPALNSLTVADGGTLIFANWETKLTVDGTKWNIPPGRRQSMPGGVTGIFYLRREPKFRAQIPVAGPWFACREYGVREPVVSGEGKEHVYYETVLTVPAGHEGERVFLRSTQPLGALVINNRAVNLPRWMKELDVTNLARPQDCSKVHPSSRRCVMA